MLAYLIHCREVPTRILNLKIPASTCHPVGVGGGGGGGGRGVGVGDERGGGVVFFLVPTHLYIVIQL